MPTAPTGPGRLLRGDRRLRVGRPDQQDLLPSRADRLAGDGMLDRADKSAVRVVETVRAAGRHEHAGIVDGRFHRLFFHAFGLHGLEPLSAKKVCRTGHDRATKTGRLRGRPARALMIGLSETTDGVGFEPTVRF